MKLHLPHLLRRAVLRAMYAATALATTLFSASYADMITPDGRTATTVMQQGNVYNVYTNTVRGQTGFNSFSTFDVYADTTANLHLAPGTANLVNVVRDKCSYIDGVLNSYKDGQIGGNVFFLNPNGIVVGKSGVVNVGSITMSTPTAYFIEQLIARDGSISPTATAAVLAGDMPINEKGLISVKGKINAIDRVEMRAGRVEVQGTVSAKVKMADVVNTGGKKMDNKGMRIEGGKLSFGRKPRAARKPAHKAEQPAEKKNDIEIFAEEVSIDGGVLAGETIYIDPDKLSVTNTVISGHYTAEARELTLNNVQSDNLQSLTLHAGNELADGTFAGDVSLTVTDSSLITTNAGFVVISADAVSAGANAAVTISDSTISAALAEGAVLTGAEPTPAAVTVSATAKSGNATVTVAGSSVSGKDVAVSTEGAQDASVTIGAGSTLQAKDALMLQQDAAAQESGTAAEPQRLSGNLQLTATAGQRAEVTLQQNSTLTAETGSTILQATGEKSALVGLGGTVDSKGHLIALSAATAGDAALTVAGTAALNTHEADIKLYAATETGNAAITLESGSALNARLVQAIAAAQEGDATLTQQQNSTITASGDAELGVTVGFLVSEEAEGDYFDEETAEPTQTPTGSGNALLTLAGNVYSKGNITLRAENNGTAGNAEVRVESTADIRGDGTLTALAGQMKPERQAGETDEQYAARWKAHLESLQSVTAPISELHLSASSLNGNAAVSVQEQAALLANNAASVQAKATKGHAVIDFAGLLQSGSITADAEGATALLRIRENGTLRSVPVTLLMTEQAADGSVCYNAQKMDAGISLTAAAPRDAEPADEDGTPVVPRKQDGVMLEVAGTLSARREEDDEEGAGGQIQLGSAGTLRTTDTAVMDAGSAVGDGGKVSFFAPEYDMSHDAVYNAAGSNGSAGTLHIMNMAVRDINDILADDGPQLTFLQEELYANGEGEPRVWDEGTFTISMKGNIILNRDLSASAFRCMIADGTVIHGNGHSLKLTRSRLNDVFPVSFDTTQYSIGDNVTIEGVKDFTVQLNTFSYLSSMLGIAATGKQYLKIGDNFNLQATGNVTLSSSGIFWNEINVGKNAHITAGGDINISATTNNGLGFAFYTSAPTSVASMLKSGLNAVGLKSDAVDALGEFGFVKVHISKVFSTVMHHVFHQEKWSPENSTYLALGFRLSFAEINFASGDNGQQSVLESTGGDVNLVTSSTAQVKFIGKSTPLLPGFALTAGFVYNSAETNLGSTLTLKGNNVTINNLTTATIDFGDEVITGPKPSETLVAVGAAVIVNNDRLNIDAGSIIEAKNDITIKSLDRVTNSLEFSVGSGKKYDYYIDDDITETDASANSPATKNSVTLGTAVLVHNSESNINAALTSLNGNITINSETRSKATLLTAADLCYTLSHHKAQDESTFLADLMKCVRIEGLSWLYNGWEDMQKTFKKGEELYGELTSILNETEENDHSVAVSLAANIANNSNRINFGGTASAKNGTVTITAQNNIDNSTHSFSSIRGVPSDKAIAGAVSVPVYNDSCVVDITGRIEETQNIVLNAVTSYPLTLDFLGIDSWTGGLKPDGRPMTEAENILRGMNATLEFMRKYFSDDTYEALGQHISTGSFGLLNTMTSTGATTMMRKTGSSSDDSMMIGGSVVVDIHNSDTVVNVRDGAVLKADNALNITAETKGQQVVFAGELPFYLQLGKSLYATDRKAASGFGGSFLFSQEKLNTVTYVGAADIEAEALTLDSRDTVFSMESSVAGTFGVEGSGVNGALNILLNEKMTVSEVSGGATLTLGSGNSSVRATDDTTTLNLVGMEGDGGRLAIGAGVAATVDFSYTAALLGNNSIPAEYKSNWDSVNAAVSKSGVLHPTSEEAITLNFNGKGALNVLAKDDSNMVSIGLAAAVLTPNTDKEALGGGADNVSVTEAKHHTAATAYNVTAADAKKSDITVEALNDAVIVSVAGDVAANASDDKAKVNEAAAIAVNYISFDTKASVIGSSLTSAGALKVHAHNRSVTNAVTLAGSGGGATAGIAAGSAWNSMSGTTGAYTTGGSLSAESIAVTAESTQDITAVTLGTSVNFSLLNGLMQAAPDQKQLKEAEQLLGESGALKDEEDHNLVREDRHDELLDIPEDEKFKSLLNEESLAFNEEGDLLLLAVGNGLSVSAGASVVRSSVDTHTEALVTDSVLTAAGRVTVAAEDTTVITQISGGVAVAQGGGSNGAAGAVLSFVPVTSKVHAGIIGSDAALTLNAAQLDVHAAAAQNARNWSLGVGLSTGSACGAVVAWSNFNDSYALAELKNVNASVSGSGQKGHDVLVEAYNHQQTTVVSAGASGGMGTFGLSGVWNHASFGGSAKTEVSGSTLTMTHAAGGDVFLHAKTENELFDVMGAVNLQIGSTSIAGVGAAVSTVYLNKNEEEDSYTSRVLVSGSTIDNAGKTTIKAENSTEGGVFGGAVAATSGKAGVGGTFSWLTDYSRTEALVQDSVLKGAGGDAEVLADSHSDVISGVGAAGLQLGAGLGAGAFVADIMKDHGTTEAIVRNSVVGAADNHFGNLNVHATADTHLNAVLVGGSVGNFAGITGQVMYAGLEHKVHALADNATITLNGNLDIGADNTVTAGRDKWCLTIGSLSVGYGGAGVGLSLLFLNDDDDTSAVLRNGSITAGSVSVTSHAESRGSTATLTGAGGAYGGGVVNVNRSDLTSRSKALVSGNGSLTTTAGGLNVRSTLEQELDTYAFGAALAGVGALTINVNLMNVEGGSHALVTDARTLDLYGDLSIGASATRKVGYVAANLAGSMLGIGINVSLMNLSRDADVHAAQGGGSPKQMSLTDNKANDDAVAALMDKAFGTAEDQLAKSKDPDADNLLGEYTGGEKQLPEDVSLSAAKEAHSVGTNSNVQAGLTLTNTKAALQDVTVGGDVSITSSESITTKATNVDVVGGLGSLGVTVIKTKMAPVTFTTVSGVRLNAGGNITLSATGSAKDAFTDVGVRGGAVNVGLSFYDWENNADTAVQVGNAAVLNAGEDLSLNAENTSEETFNQTAVHGGIADIAVLLPSFSQSCTASLSVGDNATLSARNVTLSNRNDLSLKVDMLDIVATGLGIGVTQQNTSIRDHEFIRIGAGASLTAAQALTLNNLADKDYSLKLHHVGIALVEFAFPELAADNMVDAEVNIGNAAQLRGKTVRIASRENLVRNADLKGQTGSLGSFGSRDVNEISVGKGSRNTAVFGQNVVLNGDVTVDVATTDASDIYSNALKVSLLEIATATTIKNTVYLNDSITIGDGLTATGGALTLTSESKLMPLTSLGESYGGGILDFGVNLNEELDIHLNAEVSLGSGTVDVDSFTAHALTDALVDEYGEVEGGSVVDVRSGSLTTTVKQNAAVNLAATEGKTFTLTADKVDVLARNKHLRTNSHSNDIWGSTGGLVPVLKVESTVNSTFSAQVNWGAGASLKRHVTPEAYRNRRNDKVSFRAENDAVLTTKAKGSAGGLGGETKGIVNLITTAEATTALLGNIGAWNEVDAAAVSSVNHTSAVDISTPAIGPGKMTHTNTITLNNTLKVGGNIETAGSVSLTSQGIGTQSVTNKLDGDSTSRGRSVSKTDNSALTLTGIVKAGGSATLTSSKNMTLGGSVWAGLGGYMEATLLNSSSSPQLRGYIDYMQDSLFGTAATPEIRQLSPETQNLFRDTDRGLLDGLSVSGGGLRVNSPDAAGVDKSGLHVIKNVLADVTIAFGYDSGIKLGSMEADARSCSGAFINGTPYAAAETVLADGTSQIRITNWSPKRLTLAGNYTALNAGLKVYSFGDITFTGTTNVFSLDVYTEGNLAVDKSGDYYSERSFADLYKDLLDTAKDDFKYGNLSEGLCKSLLPFYKETGSHVIQAAQNVSIRAKVVDLNGDIIAGTGDSEMTVDFSDSTTLLDNLGRDITLAEALQLYQADSSLSRFRVKDTHVGTFYFDAAAKRFGVSDISGADHHITIEADYIGSTRAAGTSKLEAQDGAFSLTVNNTSSYDLDLSNIDLNSQAKGIITLKDLSGTVTYTRDAQGNVIREVEGQGTPTLYSGQQDVAYTPQWNYLYYREEEKRRTYMWGAAPADGETESTWSESYGGVSRADWNDDFRCEKRRTEYIEDIYGYVEHFIYDYCFRADHDVAVSFNGSRTLPAALTANAVNNINVNGKVSADAVVLNSTLGAVNLAKDAALTGKNSLSITAGGDITFGPGSTLSGAAINLTAKNSIGTAAARGTIAGDTKLNARAEKAIALDALHNLTVGDIQADTVSLNVSGNIDQAAGGGLTAETADVTAGGSMALNTKVSGYLDAAAGDSITLTQDADTVLYLRHLTSDRGNISVKSPKGIQAYYNLDLDKALTDEQLSTPLSLLEAAEFYSEEYREQYAAEMEQYRRLYELKDADGNYVYRDAEGNFALTDEQRQQREQQLYDNFMEEYNSGRGDVLVESIYQLSGSVYVGGNSFSSRSDAEAYICTHTEEAARGFAAGQLDAALAQVTAQLKEGSVGSAETQMNTLAFDKSEWQPYYKNLWLMYYEAHKGEENRLQAGYVAVMQETEDGTLAVTPTGGYKYIVNENTQRAVSDWLRETSLGEQLYKLYWKRDTAGKLLYQDGDGNFIGPVGTDGVTPAYSAEMCELVTALYKGTEEAQGYRLTESDKEHLLQMGKVQSGYTQAEQLLDSVKNSLYTLGIGLALEETETVISAKNGSLSLMSEGGTGIGSDRLTVLVKADGTDANGNPVYSAWKRAYIENAEKDGGLTILSGGLNAAETRVRIDSRSFNEETMTALDIATLLSASSVSTAYDADTKQTTYTVTPTGYLGVESQTLSVVNGSGKVYIATPGDLNLTNYTLSADAHFSAAGNISGTSVTTVAGAASRLGLYSGGSIGSADKRLTMEQGGGSAELSLYAYGDAHLRNRAAGTTLRHLMAENVTMETTESVKGADGSLNNPNIYAASVTWLQNAAHTDFLGQQDEPLYITTWGNDTERNGFALDAAAAGSRLDTLSLRSGSTLYPFIYRTGENLSSIGQASITFSGGLYMNTAAVYDALRLHQRSFTEGADSVAIHYNAVTIDSDLTLRSNFIIDSENKYDFTLNGTLYFRDMEQAQLRFQGVANKLVMAGIDAGEAELTLESDADVNEIGSVVAGSMDAAVYGDLTLGAATTQDGLTLRTESGSLQLGMLLAEQGDITLQSSGDITVDYFFGSQKAELTSAAGGITVGTGMADALSLTAKNDIEATVWAAYGDTLHLGSAVSKSGSLTLTSLAQDTLLEGAVKGKAVTLNAAGIFTAAGGRISAPTGKLKVSENLVFSEELPQVVRTDKGYELTLHAGLADVARDNAVSVMRGLNLVLTGEGNNDFTGSVTLAEGGSLTLLTGLRSAELHGKGALLLGCDFDASATDFSRFSGSLEMLSGELRLTGQESSDVAFIVGANGSMVIASQGSELHAEAGTMLISGLSELNCHYTAPNLRIEDTASLRLSGTLDIAGQFTVQGLDSLEFVDGTYRLGSWLSRTDSRPNAVVTLTDSDMWVQGNVEDAGRIELYDSTLRLPEGGYLRAADIVMQGNIRVDGSVYSDKAALSGSLEVHGGSWEVADSVTISGSASADSYRLPLLNLAFRPTTLRGEGTIGTVIMSRGTELNATDLHIDDLVMEDGSRLNAEGTLGVGVAAVRGNVSVSAADFYMESLQFNGAEGAAESLAVSGNARFGDVELTDGKSISGGALHFDTLTIGGESGIAASGGVSVGSMRVKEGTTFGDLTTEWYITELTMENDARFEGSRATIGHLDSYLSYVLFDELKAERVTGNSWLYVLDNWEFDDWSEFRGSIIVLDSRNPEPPAGMLGTLSTAPSTDSPSAPQDLTSTQSSQNALTPLAEAELSRLSSGITAPTAVGGSMGDSISAPVINFTDSEESDGEKEEEKRKVTAR